VQKSCEPTEMPFGLWIQVGPRKHVLDWAQITQAKGQLLGERTCPGMLDDTLPWAVQKWPNQSICRLSCGLGLAEGSISSIVFARWRQCACHALTGRHIGARQQIRLNRPSAAAMLPYIKLLSPLIIITAHVINKELGSHTESFSVKSIQFFC